jgi:hypothetical protein
VGMWGKYSWFNCTSKIKSKEKVSSIWRWVSDDDWTLFGIL